MSSPGSDSALAQLSDACSSGRDLLGSVYVYRSISRTLPGVDQVDNPLKLCRSLCLLFEDECSILQDFEKFHWELLARIREAVECLAKEDAGAVGISSAAGSTLAEALFLVHLLDCVKFKKPGLALDCLLYETALERVLVSTGSNSSGAALEFRHRLRNCKTQVHFLTTPWSVLKSLVNVLRDVRQGARVMCRLVEFLARSLQSDQEGSGAGWLAHLRFPLLGALPIALYAHCFVSKRGVQEDNLSVRQIEACLKLLRKNPVVPGIGDIAVEVAAPLVNVLLGKETGRKLTIQALAEMDRKSMLTLEQRHSLKFTVREVREVHDQLCEEVVGFLKDAARLKKERTHQDSSHIQGSSDHSLDLSLRLLQQLSLWHSKIMKLHAWRIVQRTKSETSSDCSTLFNEYDLQYVSIVVSCLRGMAILFHKAWKALLPFLQEKSHSVCKVFFTRFFKKAGSPSDNRMQELVDILRAMEHDRVVGMSHGTDSSRSRNPSDNFDATRLECIGHVRNVVEELVALEEAHVLKARFSGLRSKSSRAIGAVAVKDCKEFLKDIYKLEIALSAKKHMLQISDLSSLCFYESNLEANSVSAGCSQNEPLRLALAALECPAASCVDAALAALSIFEDGSMAILHRFRVQHLYFELREEALSALDKLMSAIVDKSFSELKCFVGENLLKLRVDNAPARAPSWLQHKYNALFRMSLMRIAGCKVDVASALVMKVKAFFQSSADALVDSLSGPIGFKATEQSLQLLHHTHSMLSQHVSVPPWSQIWRYKLDNLVPRSFCESIVAELFREFKYFTFLNEFRGCEIKSCPIKTTTSGLTLNMSATYFGVPHILSIKTLIGRSGVEDLVAYILDWISSRLDKETISRIAELVETAGTDELEEYDILFGDSPESMIQWLESLKTRQATWQAVIDELECIGNGLAFLHLLDCLGDCWHDSTIGEMDKQLLHGDEANESITHDSEPSAAPCLLTRGLCTIQEVFGEWGHGSSHKDKIRHQLSTLFMWAAYTNENEAHGGKAVGDGLVWAIKSIVEILEQDTMWKAFSWPSIFDHTTTLGGLLGSNCVASEERMLQVRIRQWSAVWEHISFIFPPIETTFSSSYETSRPDPPLVAFFGSPQNFGISKLPQVPLRQSATASCTPFSRGQPDHRPASSLGLERDQVYRASSAEPYRRTSTACEHLSPRYALNLENCGSSRRSARTVHSKPRRSWRR